MPLPKFLKNLLTVATIVDTRMERSSLASRLDVDRVHGILDAAEGGNTRELFDLYRDMVVTDSHTQTEIGKRKLAVCGNPFVAVMPEKSPAEDIRAVEIVNQALNNTPGMLRSLINILDGSLYPLSVTEKVFQASGSGFILKGLYQVPYRLLDYTTGKLQIRDVDTEGRELGSLHTPDPDRYIIHRGHLLSTPDNWGGPLRSILFWWLLSAMDRDWWGRMLERYGTPFMVGRYDANDDQSRRVLERAFSLACKLGGLAVSSDTQIEIKQAAASDSGEAYEKFLSICQREKSKAILGQTLSAEAQSTGLGSGVANAHEAVRADIRRFDSVMLIATLRDQLFQQLLDINGCRGRMPDVTSESNVDSPDKLNASGTLISALYTAGVELSDEGIKIMSEKIGLPLQRTAQQKFGVTPFSSGDRGRPTGAARSLETIAQTSAADLAQAFRGDLAPVARIIRESRSADECLAAVEAFMAQHSPRRSQEIVELALTAYAANALI